MDGRTDGVTSVQSARGAARVRGKVVVCALHSAERAVTRWLCVAVHSNGSRFHTRPYVYVQQFEWRDHLGDKAGPTMPVAGWMPGAETREGTKWPVMLAGQPVACPVL